MEEQKKGFEEEAMKYVDWGNKPAIEEEQPKAPEQPAPVEEEQPQQDEHEETEEEMYERLQKEQQEQLKKMQEQQEKVIKRMKEEMAKAHDDMMKAYGANVFADIDVDQIMDDMMNMKEEDIVTPETDKIFFAWIASRFPGLIEKAKENVLKKIQKQKEDQEKYMQEVNEMFPQEG